METFEKCRNELQENLLRSFNVEITEKALEIIGSVLSYYDLTEKTTDIICYNGQVPRLVKEYIAVKIMEGRSKETTDLYKVYLCKFFEYIRKPPEEVQTNDIRMFLYWYQNERIANVKVSNRTLDTIRGIIGYFFQWLQDSDYLTKNPAKPIKPIKYEKKHKEAMTRKELISIEMSCKTPREKALITTLYATGCRISEIAGIKISDICFDTHEIKVLGKGNKHRTTWLNDRAELAIKEYVLSRSDDSPYLFVSSRAPHGKMSAGGLRKLIENIGSRSETPINVKPTPHVYRHTTATLALKSGMPVTQVKEMLGHENISTTMQYLDMDEAGVKEAHKKYVV